MKHIRFVTLGLDTYVVTVDGDDILACKMYVGESEYPHEADFSSLPLKTQVAIRKQLCLSTPTG